MAFVIKYDINIQNDRKVMNIVDSSDGWNTDHYQLPEYYHDNPDGNIVKLNIAIESKDFTTNKKFLLTKDDAYVPASDEIDTMLMGTVDSPVLVQSELRWSLLLSFKGDLVLINDLTSINQDDYDVMPDGIYTIEYIVDSGTDGQEAIISKEEFVVSNGAEDTVIACANEIADATLVCRDINVDKIADYLLKESMLFAANTAAFISRKDRVINILGTI